jgi:ligand-binding sensor domain-containing protein/two-component sensor histidine kinase
MRRFCTFLIFVCFFVGTNEVFAQDEEPQNIVTYFTLDQGLNERAVVDILQDSTGLLWIVTASGISQYDGYSFTKLEDASEDFMLNDNAIEEAILLHNQNILNFYIFNDHFFDQISLLDYTVTQVLYSDISEKGALNSRCFSEDGNMIFSFVAEDSLHFYEWDGTISRQMMSMELASFYEEYIYSFTFSKDKEFYICTPEEILNVSETGNILQSFPFDEYRSRDENENEILTCSLLKGDGMGRVWVSFESHGGVFWNKMEDNSFKKFQLVDSQLFIGDFWKDDIGNLLFSFNSGSQNRISKLTLLDPDNTIHDFTHLTEVYPSISEIYASDFFDYLILGSHLGFAKVNNKVNSIRKFLYEDTKSGKWGASIFGITAGETGEVFISREVKNWYRYDTRSHELEPKYLVNKLTGVVEYLDCGRNIIYDGNFLWGSSFINSKEGQLLKIDKNTFEFEAFPYRWPIQFKLKDAKDDIWVLGGLKSGKGILSKFDKENNVYTDYYNLDLSNPLEDKYCRYMIQGSDGQFYIGTSEGIVIINPQNRTSKLINHFYSGIPKDVICLFEDKEQNRLWAGTLGDGLFNFDSELSDFIHYDQKKGLSNNNVVGIIKDDIGNLWISTFNGISLFRRSPEGFITISEREGLTHNEFNRYSFFQNENGDLMFGGINGLNILSPQEIISNLQQPKIFLTNIQYSDPKGNGNTISIKYGQLSEIDDIVLPYSDRYFRCSFSLTDFNAPDHNSFFYKLDGSGDEWHDLRNQNSIILPSLGQGSYVLSIKGRNYKGMDSSNSISLKILVNAPFYFQLWFIVLILLGVAGLVSLYYYNKIDKLKKLETLRLKISSDLHDDVGGILAALAIRSEVISNNTSDDHKNEFRKMSELSRKALSQMRDIVWTVDSRKNKFSDLQSKIEEYAGELLAENGINYTFELDKELENLKLDENKKSQLLMICKEALTNILKHSGAENVKISLSQSEKNLKFVIQDDGKSEGVISKAGSGIQNMEMRANKMDGTFDFATGNGTKITITL